MLSDASLASGCAHPRGANVRPSSASRGDNIRRLRLGKGTERKLERGTRASAAEGGGHPVVQVAQGATTAATAALQNLWESREALVSPFSGVQPFASLWLSKDEGAPSGLGRSRQAQSVGEREVEALRLLKEQASANKAIQLLRKRAKEGSLPMQRNDGAKLGLVVEGGGMRGAVSGGALQAIHDLGLRDCFDAVYGSSAGAINATYFLSGQREGVDIYSQDITNTNFIDLKRLLKRQDSNDYRPALDLFYLLDYVMDEVKPLDWQAVVDSPIPLKVVASCLDSLQPILLSNFVDTDDLRECLRASAAVPEVAGPPVRHRGRRMVDAAVFEAIPFRAAIADGCTHVLALPTRPPYKREDFFGKLVDDSVATIVKKAVLSPGYMQKAWVREVEYQRAFGSSPEELLVRSMEPDAHKLPGMRGCHAFPFFPGSAASYSPLCIDAATIMLGIAEGRAAVEKILGSPVVRPAAPAPAKTVKEAAPKPTPVIASTRAAQ